MAFTATFRGRRVATREALARLLIGASFMTQRVSALIRVHGIWLWLHRLPIGSGYTTPDSKVSTTDHDHATRLCPRNAAVAKHHRRRSEPRSRG